MSEADEQRRLDMLAGLKGHVDEYLSRTAAGTEAPPPLPMLVRCCVAAGWWHAAQTAERRLREDQPPDGEGDYCEGFADGHRHAIAKLIGPAFPQADDLFLVRELADWLHSLEEGTEPRMWCPTCGAMRRFDRRDDHLRTIRCRECRRPLEDRDCKRSG